MSTTVDVKTGIPGSLSTFYIGLSICEYSAAQVPPANASFVATREVGVKGPVRNNVAPGCSVEQG